MPFGALRLSLVLEFSGRILVESFAREAGHRNLGSFLGGPEHLTHFINAPHPISA